MYPTYRDPFSRGTNIYWTHFTAWTPGTVWLPVVERGDAFFLPLPFPPSCFSAHRLRFNLKVFVCVCLCVPRFYVTEQNARCRTFRAESRTPIAPVVAAVQFKKVSTRPGKPIMHTAPSLRSFSSVVLQIVPVLIILTMVHSRPFKQDRRMRLLSTPLSPRVIDGVFRLWYDVLGFVMVYSDFDVMSLAL